MGNSIRNIQRRLYVVNGPCKAFWDKDRMGVNCALAQKPNISMYFMNKKYITNILRRDIINLSVI